MDIGAIEWQDSVGRLWIPDDGTFPGNPEKPFLVYKDSLAIDPTDPARSAEGIFVSNGWTGTWRNGVFRYHHYHSTAHEVLGVYRGGARVQFGGPAGIILDVQQGDAVLIPAGVAHKLIESRAGFGVVGAYPRGQSWDLLRGQDGDRPRADRNIAEVPDPATDPLLGEHGPLVALWGGKL